MPRQAIDLSSHLNQTVERGGAADFPVGLKPLTYEFDGRTPRVANRLAVVREDTGEAIAVVSDRYTLVPHQRILDAIAGAVRDLDVGPVPHGIYMDRNGARMRALFKFPALDQAVTISDRICPCVKVQNTYDATSRVGVQIGAFRFVCTNLAVGGGGAFAGGFMAVHFGEIPIEEVAEQLVTYLQAFPRIVGLYRAWSDLVASRHAVRELAENLPKRVRQHVNERLADGGVRTVYDAYNATTWYATHRMRSARSAFDLLERINREFQGRFAPSPN